MRDTPVDFEWLPTAALGDAAHSLRGFDGLVVAPGTPCASTEGALAAIRYARERDLPLVAMCGGFQHVVLEFVRNVIGLHDAEHAETDAAAATLAVTPLACSLVGQRHPVHLVAGSRTAAIYRSGVAVEPFFCSYGLNHALEPSVEAAGLRVSGRDRDFTARVVELHEHSFFIATLYVFQARNERPNPHPLTAAFLDAARAARLVRGASGAQLARPLTS